MCDISEYYQYVTQPHVNACQDKPPAFYFRTYTSENESLTSSGLKWSVPYVWRPIYEGRHADEKLDQNIYGAE